MSKKPGLATTDKAAYMREYYKKQNRPITTIIGKKRKKNKEILDEYFKDKGKVINKDDLYKKLEDMGFADPSQKIDEMKKTYLKGKTLTKKTPKTYTGAQMDPNQLKELDKYAKYLKEQGVEGMGDTYATSTKTAQQSIYNRAANRDFKFTLDKEKPVTDTYTKPQKDKIKKAFNISDEDFVKSNTRYGVPSGSGVKGEKGKELRRIYALVKDFVKRGFKVGSQTLPSGELPEAAQMPLDKQTEIKTKWELPDDYIDKRTGKREWNFKRYLYGVPKKGATNSMARKIEYEFVRDPSTKKYKFVGDHKTPHGWMMTEMFRSGVEQQNPNYQPLSQMVGDDMKIVGFTDETVGGDWYVRDEFVEGDGRPMRLHPHYDEVKKFIDIAKKSNAPLNKTLKALLKRIGVVDNRITLTTLLNYLAREQGYKPVARAIVLHHKRGLKGKTGSATSDLQLLRNINNSAITDAERNIRYSVEELGQEPNADDIKILKDNQARVMAGGKEYGFGPKTPGGALRKLEKLAETQLVGRDKAWGQGLVDYANTQFNKLIAEGEAGGPICILVRKKGAIGGSQQPGCGDEVRQALQEDPDKLIQEAAQVKVKPGENTKFRTIARQLLSKLPKGGRLGAILAGAGAVGAGTYAMMGDATADETGITDQSMKYNSTTGEFVNTETGDPETQTGVLNWIADNPGKSGFAALPIMLGAGQALAKAGLPGGRYLTSWTAAIPAMMIPEKMWQYKEGMEAGEMITDPLNALWALGIENKASLAAAEKWYRNLPEGQRTRLMSMQNLKDLKTTQGWKNLPSRLRTAILSPTAAGTDLAFQKRLKPATKKLTEAIIGSPGAQQAAKKGLGALAKRGAIGLGAAALLPATVAAGLVSAPLTLGLGALSFGYAQYKDYRDGKKIVDSMRARGKISEEDANNYMSLILQGSLPFGIGNRLFGDDEMTLRGQYLDSTQQRQVLAGMEEQIDLFQDERQQVRALDRADDFDFFNEGGRVGMKGGGMDRRGFLKWLASLGAGVVAGASGLFKTGAKKGIEQVAKEVVKEAPQMLPGGVPAWFPRAVAKIKADGKLIEMADKDYVNGDIYEILLPVKQPKYSNVPPYNAIGTEMGTKRVLLEENPVSGTIEISWDVEDFGDTMKRQINFAPGETGFQKFGVDPEHPGAWQYERVKISDPDFTYGNPDTTLPERDDFEVLDIVADGDNVVGALENLTKTVDEKILKEGDEAFKKKMFKDIEGEGALQPDPEGHMTPDGWSGEGTQEVVGGDVPDWVPKDTWQKKAGGGTVETGAIARRQSLVPPLAGPNPQGIMGLPSDVKQVRVG